ncbi:MAG: NAD(P)/FAD-dependent oxidoreductase [Nitriliruptoraceae bacterium]
MSQDRVRDVLIIGGGAVGATLARALSRFHLDVALLEWQAEVAFGVSKANSGIVHSAMHASPDTLKGKLEYPGNLGWRRLQDELGFGLNNVGEVLVALDDEQLVKIEQIRQQGIRKGIPGTQAWTAERTLDAQPNLTRDVKGAVWAPTACVFNPYEAVMLVADAARRNGVTIAEEQRVVAIDPRDLDDPDAPLTVRTETDVWRARFVINAAGLFADDIAELAGVRDFQILPRKGEEYLLDKRLSGIVTSIIFPCPSPVSKGTLVNPTVDGTIMVGPTAQTIDDKFDTSTTEEGAAQVFTNARKLVPTISERDIIAEFAGLRPVSDTEDFIVGPTERRGFLNAAGIQSPGLTGAPALAELLVDLLADEGLELEEKTDWDPTAPHPVKFAQLSTEDQQALARRDPRFAQLVCRCEIITEAEIRDAMDRGARTLDGLKFRTRAGMGRCQGGFCTWGCMALLAEHQGIPMPEVTKRGSGSWIVCDRDDHPVTTARIGG